MKTPDKIYISKELVRYSFNETNSKSDIEYTRTNAFIEKACKWLGPVFKDLSGHYSGAELLNDFTNYMKGEGESK